MSENGHLKRWGMRAAALAAIGGLVALVAGFVGAVVSNVWGGVDWIRSVEKHRRDGDALMKPASKHLEDTGPFGLHVTLEDRAILKKCDETWHMTRWLVRMQGATPSLAIEEERIRSEQEPSRLRLAPN